MSATFTFSSLQFLAPPPGKDDTSLDAGFAVHCRRF